MTPSSPEQQETAYEYLKWCRADIASETILLDSTRISKLKLAKAVPLREKINTIFYRFKSWSYPSLPCAPQAPINTKLIKLVIDKNAN
jgi:hypothetical protein